MDQSLLAHMNNAVCSSGVPADLLKATQIVQDLIQAGHRVQAAELAEKTLENFPADALLHNLLGGTYDHLARQAKTPDGARAAEVHRYRRQARDHYLKASDLKPSDYKFAYNAAVMLRILHDDRAFDYIERALASHPRDVVSWLELGTMYEMSDNARAACECFNNAACLRPQDMRARARLEAYGREFDGRADISRALLP